eukprot:Blabericola_migrator_1__2403@NODE_1675_length_4032_cov_167_795208_g1088_i0_p3_GENE_NODE_1675_length_4032_cov_167_795208_g1088_i0NODE_1675_length_4032_cov_167_795208_g1088_i0_p3_ORF_typecomplete_len268_score35_01_NODE_1675_length_4032_cov_167_795208_g1088_i017672570
MYPVKRVQEISRMIETLFKVPVSAMDSLVVAHGEFARRLVRTSSDERWLPRDVQTRTWQALEVVISTPAVTAPHFWRAFESFLQEKLPWAGLERACQGMKIKPRNEMGRTTKEEIAVLIAMEVKEVFQSEIDWVLVLLLRRYIKFFVLNERGSPRKYEYALTDHIEHAKTEAENETRKLLEAIAAFDFDLGCLVPVPVPLAGYEKAKLHSPLFSIRQKEKIWEMLMECASYASKRAKSVRNNFQWRNVKTTTNDTRLAQQLFLSSSF